MQGNLSAATSQKANLYSATFGLPVAAATYNTKLTTLITQVPNKKGYNSFSVKAASVKPGALTQYILVWPFSTCSTFSGQVWSGASNFAAMGLCTKVPFPWELAVTYCGP